MGETWQFHRSRMCILLLGTLGATSADRAYPLGCSQQPPSYYNYDSYPFPPPNVSIQSTDDYLLLRRLGAGKFSDVFEAVDVDLERKLCPNKAKEHVDPRTLAVLKCLKPVSERKIRRELLVLSHASQLPNLARLLAVVVPKSLPASDRAPASLARLPPMPSLVLEHAGVNSQWLCHGRGNDPTSGKGSGKNHYLSDYDIRYYLCHLLFALDALHSRGIMHRDVKPRNVLINRNGNDSGNPLMLIDLGLADFFLPNTRYNVRVASRHYKSPELLVGYEYYDYAIDLWGVGCMLAGLLFRREPFFRGKDNIDQLGKIVAVLGTADLIAYMVKFGIEMKPELQNIIAKYAMRGGYRKPWLSFVTNGVPVPSMDGIDLLGKLLVYDHDVRFTANEATKHRFFDPVRERVEKEIRSQTMDLKTNETYASPR